MSFSPRSIDFDRLIYYLFIAVKFPKSFIVKQLIIYVSYHSSIERFAFLGIIKTCRDFLFDRTRIVKFNNGDEAKIPYSVRK